MASSDILPTYLEPCLSERHNSLESTWLNVSDFGECYPPPPDSILYPRLVPVYNGKVLDIEPELVHASLSGISIKHYYGKCVKPEEDENVLYGDQTELYDFEWVDDKPESVVSPRNEAPSASSSESGDFIYRDFWHDEGAPICALPKINCRNSFWNIHRPEMCKLTWGQKYVSATIVTEHLHDHLIHHGPLCRRFHTQEDRNIMLNKELDEYGRLKVLLCPKELPPEEPPYNFKDPPLPVKGTLHPSCKTRLPPQITEAINENDRYLPLSDDDETVEKSVRRSKEEFCVTIGKHVRKPPIIASVTALEERQIQPKFSFGEGEEAEEEEGDYGTFHYDWFLCSGEEYLGKYSDTTETTETNTLSESDLDTKIGDTPMRLDEFCRGVSKADYSDIQCKPDF